MILLILLIGFGLLGTLGWCALRVTEGDAPVLSRAERVVWSLTLGPTLGMLLIFLVHWTGLVQLDIWGYVLPILAAIGVLLGICAKRRLSLLPRVATHKSDQTAGAAARWAIGILLVWTLVKVVAGSYDLVSVPTYWDDAFNNWNMRGKMFYVQHALVLEIPLTKLETQSAAGVSSYPPTVPMLKAMLSSLRGEWSESLVNSVHAVWYVLLLAVFFLLLRRFTGSTVSGLGVYLLASLPLVLIQGMNPYADVFLALHLLLVMSGLLAVAHADDARAIRSWSALTCLAVGLFVFTKNEALLLYAPLCAIALLWILWRKRSHLGGKRALVRTVSLGLSIVLALVLPWLAFKWTHGLSFGNAKSVSGLAIAFNAKAVHAIWYQLMQEPNFLLLPLVFVLSPLYGWKHLKDPILAVPAALTVLAFLEQSAIFVFTPLANEAIMQTGVARGQVHIAPIGLLFVVLVWERMLRKDVKHE